MKKGGLVRTLSRSASSDHHGHSHGGGGGSGKIKKNHHSSKASKKNIMASTNKDSTMNIFCSSGLVSHDFILDQLEEVKKNHALIKKQQKKSGNKMMMKNTKEGKRLQKITHLELEDLLMAKEHHQSLLPVVKSLLVEDAKDSSTGSVWKSIKFVDSFQPDDFDWWQAMTQAMMQEYEHTIPNFGTKYATDNTVQFQANVEIRSDSYSKSSVASLLDSLAAGGGEGVGQRHIQRFSFGGALYGIGDERIPEVLDGLFDKDFILAETVTLHIDCGWASSSSKTQEESSWKKTLEACVRKLKGIEEQEEKKEEVGDNEHQQQAPEEQLMGGRRVPRRRNCSPIISLRKTKSMDQTTAFALQSRAQLSRIDHGLLGDDSQEDDPMTTAAAAGVRCVSDSGLGRTPSRAPLARSSSSSSSRKRSSKSPTRRAPTRSSSSSSRKSSKSPTRRVASFSNVRSASGSSPMMLSSRKAPSSRANFTFSAAGEESSNQEAQQSTITPTRSSSSSHTLHIPRPSSSSRFAPLSSSSKSLRNWSPPNSSADVGGGGGNGSNNHDSSSSSNDPVDGEAPVFRSSYPVVSSKKGLDKDATMKRSSDACCTTTTSTRRKSRSVSPKPVNVGVIEDPIPRSRRPSSFSKSPPKKMLSASALSFRKSKTTTVVSTAA